MPGRILVTGAGGPAGRSLLHQLASRGVDAMGVDMIVPAAAPLPVLAVSAARDPRSLQVMRTIIAAHGIDVVIPTVSEELPIISAARQSLGSNVHVLVAPAAAVTVANDKLLTARLLDAADVPVPVTLTAAELEEDGANAALGVPFIVKPRVSRGARGVRLVRDAAALGPVNHALIAQSFASGVEYAPVVFASAAAEPPLVIVLEKMGLSDGEVGNATSVRAVSGAAVADGAAAARDAVLALGLTGPVDVDVRRDASGTPRVLELNARFGANSAAAPALLDRVLREIERMRAGGHRHTAAVSA